MSYMKQMLQEQSMFFSELDNSMLLDEGLDLTKVKEILIPAMKQDPKAAKLKKLVIEAEGLLKSNDELSRSNRNKLWTVILSILRVLVELDYVVGGTAIVGLAVLGGAVGGVGLAASMLIKGLIPIALNRLIRFGVKKAENATERKAALKTLSELKKLEKKVPQKEKAKVRSQINKLESALKEN